MNHLISKIKLPDCHRICGIQVNISPRPICFFSVYLPTRSGCTDDFKEMLDQIDALMNTYACDSDVVYIGDFNADLGPAGGPRATTPSNEQGRILQKYLDKWDFVSCHLQRNLNPQSYTYFSEAHNSKSTIDHIIVHSSFLNCITDIKVLEESALNLSDHLPVVCSIALKTSNSPIAVNRQIKPSPPYRPNWSKLSPEEILSLYTEPLESRLNNFISSIPTSSNQNIDAAIDKDTDAIATMLFETAKAHIPPRKFIPHLTPKWSDSLQAAKKSSKHAFFAWKSAGKPSDPSNQLRIAYKTAKGVFRSELRHHIKDLREAFLDSLDTSCTDPKRLFDRVRKFYCKSQAGTKSLQVNDTLYNSDNILSGWALYFGQLLSPNKDPVFDLGKEMEITTLYNQLVSTISTDQLQFSSEEVLEAISSLAKGKAPGPDGIEGEHLLYAGSKFISHLTSLLNSIAKAGYIPKAFRKGFTIPLLKGPNKDVTDPGNYRGISLLSNMAKVLEKLLLPRIEEIVQLNPLQGGFRPGLSSNHSALILQEAVCSLRMQKLKAFVAFLDAQKAFDSVWHAGLLVKLHQRGISGQIWHLINHWYSSSFTSVLWEGNCSPYVPILQGVRQGAILSPLLYSIFVDELLDVLLEMNIGAHINEVFIGSPMYADDLALIAGSPESLQVMLNTVFSYSCKWRYKINPHKSAILVFGESTQSRQRNRQVRHWSLGNTSISERDEINHLGILRTVHNSTISRTNGRATAGRSAFFSLNAIGARFGNLHPSTSIKLYSTLCLPILLFGSEIWSPSKTEILMLERVHRKILRTIQGLPTRCPSSALNGLVGTLSIMSTIAQRKLSFIFTIASLDPTALVRIVVVERLKTPVPSSVICSWNSLLENYSLPLLPELLSNLPCSKQTWKKSCKSILAARQYNQLLSDCVSLPIVNCSSSSLSSNKIILHWLTCKGDRQMLQRSNFRIRILVGCDGLETDAARFRYRRPGLEVGCSSCRLCSFAPETSFHFITECAALQCLRSKLLNEAPTTVTQFISSPHMLFDIIMGITWVDDMATQKFCVDYLFTIKAERSKLLMSPT